MKQVLLALIFLSVAAAASAQTGGSTIVSINLEAFRAADPITGPPFVPVQNVAWPLAPLSCNLPPSPAPTGTVVNPGVFRFDDPAFPASPSPLARECRINMGVWFASFPAATGYKVTGTPTYADGFTAARSNATGPFDVQPGFHAPLTGAGVR